MLNAPQGRSAFHAVVAANEKMKIRARVSALYDVHSQEAGGLQRFSLLSYPNFQHLSCYLLLTAACTVDTP
jgi:hypothetical protein